MFDYRSDVWIVCIFLSIARFDLRLFCRVIPKPLCLLIFCLVLYTMRIKSNALNHVAK